MSEVPLLAPVVGDVGVVVDDPTLLAEKYQQYLRDESKLSGKQIAKLFFPKNADQLSAILAGCCKDHQPVTISNARTGILGGAVPQTGWLVSLEQMTSISPPVVSAGGEASIQVGAGVWLAHLNEFLSSLQREVYFPVDPTETSAAIGGMAATNASGARTYHYGPMRNWVNWLRVVLADGSRLEIRRGQYLAKDGTFCFHSPSETRTLSAKPILKPKTKNAIGYPFDAEVDLVDVFLGSEGTLGVITDIELKLAPIPQHRLYYLQFFPSDLSALDFVERVRADGRLSLLAVEFVDGPSLRLIQTSSVRSSCAPAVMIRDKHQAAVYLELVLDEPEQLESAFEILSSYLTDADPEQSYAGTEERELRELKTFRHAVPETINSLIAKRKMAVPELYKVATDMAVPDDRLREIYCYYVEELRKHHFEYAIFGHAGNNHFHVNIMPRTLEELRSAKDLYKSFAVKVVEMKGAVAAEHGIGRTKKEFLAVQYSGDVIDNMRQIKRFFDPRGILNPGVLFD